MSDSVAIQKITEMRARKVRARDRKVAEGVNLANHYDTITRAAKVAEYNGAIDVLEELLSAIDPVAYVKALEGDPT